MPSDGSPQGDEVRHELRRDPVALAHLGGVHDLRALLAAGADVEHGDPVPRALVHVAVAGHHEGGAAGLDLGVGVGAEEVVRLELVVVGDHPSELAEERRAVGELRSQLVRDGRAVRVVAGERLDPVAGGVGAEAEDDRARVMALHLQQDHVGGAEQRVDRPPLRVGDGLGQRVERPEEERGRVDDQERAGYESPSRKPWRQLA
jgi:hypothetical protein